MAKVKPCPVCHEDAWWLIYHTEDLHYFVKCNNCGFRTRDCVTFKQAKKAWNKLSDKESEE